MDPFDRDDDWAEYGAFVASLHDEEMAFASALAPSAKAQTYLALLPNSDFFIVLHGLHRWVTTPPSRSVTEGKLVAFEGETLGKNGDEPPDLLRFDGEWYYLMCGEWPHGVVLPGWQLGASSLV